MTDQPPTVAVPREPTEAMIEAGRSALIAASIGSPSYRDDASSTYRAMISAAPAQPPAALDEAVGLLRRLTAYDASPEDLLRAEAETADYLAAHDFCGAQPRTSTYETESLWSHDQVTYTKVFCDECDIGFATEPGYELEAPAAWNRRALAAPGGEAEPVAWQFTQGGEPMPAVWPYTEAAKDPWLSCAGADGQRPLFTAPPKPVARESGTDDLHKVIVRLREHISTIQAAKRDVDRNKAAEFNPMLAAINDLPNIVRNLENAEFLIEGDFERYEDALPPEPVGWRPDRESVARLVDPQAWALIDHWKSRPNRPDLEARIEKEARESSRRADAIIALTAPSPKGGA